MTGWRKIFDRLNRYRIATALLAFPTIYILWTDAHFVGHTMELTVRVVYRIGLVILLAAVAIDWWEVYTGKRKVKKMIKQRLKDNE